MEDVKVSVLCTAYNHEKFLRQCLDGFVMQKTNFKFEVIINDDASTDGTKAIIEEYVEKYPEIIIPIFQTENQYSKNLNIIDKFLFPKSKGKYIALCEGDDYWCDENKLQLQYDYMESDPECVVCYHKTIFHDLNGKIKDSLNNNWKEVHRLTESDVFLTYHSVHTSSMFIRREYFVKPEWAEKYWTGDLVRKCINFHQGKLVALPQVMSVYNWHNPNGVMELKAKMNDKKILIKGEQMNEFLEKYNSFTNYQYDSFVKARIYVNDINYLSKYHKDYKNILKNHECLVHYKKHMGYKKRFKLFLLLNFPSWLYRLYLKNKRR